MFQTLIKSLCQNTQTLGANCNFIIATLVRGHISNTYRDLLIFSDY